MFAEGAKVVFTVTDSLMVSRPYRKSRKKVDVNRTVDAGTVGVVVENHFGTQILLIVELEDGQQVYVNCETHLAAGV